MKKVLIPVLLLSLFVFMGNQSPSQNANAAPDQTKEQPNSPNNDPSKTGAPTPNDPKNKDENGTTSMTLTLKVQKAPTDVRAMGLEIWFNPKVVAFEKYERQELFAKSFSLFGSNVVRPGQLRMGGIEGGQTPVTQGISGKLLTLKFKKLKDGDPGFKFMNLKDDLKEWPTRASACLEKDLFSGLMLCKEVSNKTP